MRIRRARHTNPISGNFPIYLVQFHGRKNTFIKLNKTKVQLNFNTVVWNNRMLFIVLTVFKHHKNKENILSCRENCLWNYIIEGKIGMKKNRFFSLLVWRTKHRIVWNWFIRCYLHKVTVININKSVYISTNMRLYDSARSYIVWIKVVYVIWWKSL